MRQERKQVVIAGFGETGILTAISLGKKYDIIGITPKPGFVSGQELGTRVSNPLRWMSENVKSFSQFKSLDGDHLRIIQGIISSVDTANKLVVVKTVTGEVDNIKYDTLLVSSGVTNGFWRDDKLQSFNEVRKGIEDIAQRIKHVETISIIGGGPAGVSTAYNIKKQNMEKNVHLFYSRDLPLPGYHPRTRRVITKTLFHVGIHMHANHRAEAPVGFMFDTPTTFPVSFSTGQPDFHADLTIWTIGKAKPNSSYLPSEFLTHDGFVKVDEYLRVNSKKDIFAVGDIAFTDAGRTSARNEGHKIAAENINCFLQGKDEKCMRKYVSVPYKWGSILGPQETGLWVFFKNGWRINFPYWFHNNVLLPVAKDYFIYGGIRKDPTMNVLQEKGSQTLSKY